MKINIYYGGRGLLDDPTLYVVNKMEDVLKELRVNVERYNIYEHKNEISTLPHTFKEADGIILATTVEDLADEDGYAYLGDLGTLLIKKQPDFDARNYGFAKLSRFIAALDGFELDERHNPKYQGTQVFVRNKK